MEATGGEAARRDVTGSTRVSSAGSRVFGRQADTCFKKEKFAKFYFSLSNRVFSILKWQRSIIKVLSGILK
ncbi:MAG: hypothetical protein R2778_04210 [Saprospiraceae bacterium]